MRRFVICCALWMTVAVGPLFAGEAEIAAKLRALGGTVTESDGAVTKIMLRECSKLGADDFQQIGQLKQLKSLTLFGSCRGLNDQTLPMLAGLQQLEEMGTDGVQLSDAGLEHFKPLVNLRSLAFFHISFQLPGFTGAGFAHLKSLPKLERLTVAGTTFNDEGMAAIGQLTQLKEFRTWHTFQTQAGNVHLAKLTQLRSLMVGQRLRNYAMKPCPVSLDNASVPTLAQIASLESLGFDEVRLTAAGLQSLKSLTKLKKLTLNRTDISDDDLAKLRAELKGVTIERKPLDETEKAALEKMLKP